MCHHNVSSLVQAMSCRQTVAWTNAALSISQDTKQTAHAQAQIFKQIKALEISGVFLRLLHAGQR